MRKLSRGCLRFFGIVVGINTRDHAPPHFHVRYAGQRGSVEIDTLQVLGGRLGARVRRLVVEWAGSHRAELPENWKRAQAGLPLHPIDPLE